MASNVSNAFSGETAVFWSIRSVSGSISMNRQNPQGATRVTGREKGPSCSCKQIHISRRRRKVFTGVYTGSVQGSRSDKSEIRGFAIETRLPRGCLAIKINERRSRGEGSRLVRHSTSSFVSSHYDRSALTTPYSIWIHFLGWTINSRVSCFSPGDFTPPPSSSFERCRSRPLKDYFEVALRWFSSRSLQDEGGRNRNSVKFEFVLRKSRGVYQHKFVDVIIVDACARIIIARDKRLDR